MFRSFLVAYDGSPSSELAFSRSLELARQCQARLTVVSITQLPQPSSEEETEAGVEASREDFERRLAGLRERAEAAAVEALLPEVLQAAPGRAYSGRRSSPPLTGSTHSSDIARAG
jgi:nucleotide-binding universal stress UspA family protein